MRQGIECVQGWGGRRWIGLGAWSASSFAVRERTGTRWTGGKRKEKSEEKGGKGNERRVTGYGTRTSHSANRTSFSPAPIARVRQTRKHAEIRFPRPANHVAQTRRAHRALARIRRRELRRGATGRQLRGTRLARALGTVLVKCENFRTSKLSKAFNRQ
jgi:hypothetical protein